VITTVSVSPPYVKWGNITSTDTDTGTNAGTGTSTNDGTLVDINTAGLRHCIDAGAINRALQFGLSPLLGGSYPFYNSFLPIPAL
jgi:hypothetical protein